MNSTSQNLTVLLDRATLQKMRLIDMLGRIDQIRATGRYKDIHIDYRTGEVVAKVIA